MKLSPRMAWKLWNFGCGFYCYSEKNPLMRVDRIRWWWEGIGDRIMAWAEERCPELDTMLALNEILNNGGDGADSDCKEIREWGRFCDEVRARWEECEPLLKIVRPSIAPPPERKAA